MRRRKLTHSRVRYNKITSYSVNSCIRSVGYQKLLTHKNAISQSKRVGARETEDKAPTMERTEDAEDGYVGPIYDAKEDKKQKVKERHTKERERRKEQSKKRVPYETFVTLNGLQGATGGNPSKRTTRPGYG